MPGKIAAHVDEAKAGRHRATLQRAHSVGLLGDTKNARIAGRVPAKLIAAAKKRAGTDSDTKVIEIALATLALEDDFGAKLSRRKASIPKDLGFDI